MVPLQETPWISVSPPSFPQADSSLKRKATTSPGISKFITDQSTQSHPTNVSTPARAAQPEQIPQRQGNFREHNFLDRSVYRSQSALQSVLDYLSYGGGLALS